MTKHSLLFHSSVVAMPLEGTYEAVNNAATPLIFKHLENGSLLQISLDGRLLYHRKCDTGFYWTYITDIHLVNDGDTQQCTFFYFDVEVLLQVNGNSMKVGEYILVENINTSMVALSDTDRP